MTAPTSGGNSRPDNPGDTGGGPAARQHDPRTITSMIGYLEGTWQGSVVLTAGGVGYDVTPDTNPTDGDRVAFWCRTVVAHDGSWTLYGFTTRAARDLFDQLRKVPGVGPATAASVTGLGVETVHAALRAGDGTTLTAAKGVSTRTAAKILAALDVPADTSEEAAELIDAIVVLGHPRAAAAAAVAGTSGPPQTRIRDALSALAQSR